ncbi:MAG: hypothetical protein M1282_13825 [Chloroflexi bacterium]|nr:hypothetical protein [Chloroflexota bacterium]
MSTIKKTLANEITNTNIAVAKIEDGISAELNKLRKLSKKDLVRKNEDIKQMIGYYNSLTNSVEERRNKIYDFNLQYLAVLLTASGILYSFKDKIEYWMLIILATLLIIQSLSAIWIIVTYELQSKYRYPFLKLEKYANKWKWFYYGNPFILKIDRNVFVQPNNDELTKMPYLEGLKFFATKYHREQVEDEVSDNVQQLYLLQVHNYYKNQFYLSLVRIRLWSLQLSVIALVIELIYLRVYPWLMTLLRIYK